ncbi:MAG: hypothetical protein AB1414_19380, partial [bacterium]
SPANNSYYLVGETIDCTAQAYCDECGEISGDIVWSAVEELAEDGIHQFPDGSGPSYSINPPDAGHVYIDAKITCPHGDDIDSIHETVFEVEITSPVTPPPTANNFVFSLANPGVCDVPCEAEAKPHEYTPEIEPWTIDPIRGSILTTIPTPPKGGVVLFTFTGLPYDNGQFGNKKVRAELTLGGKTDKDETIVQIFFPRDGTNHPGGGTPNWYYYWSQALRVMDKHTYNGDLETSRTIVFSATSWIIEIGRNANWPQGNPPTGNDYIDGFWATNLHEFWHRDHRVYNFKTYGTWGNLPLEVDPDRDDIDNTWEEMIGTDPYTWNSTEEGGEWAELNGTYGYDSLDWGYPGSQWK